ncbi:hypothetical protein RFI_03006, partial [Reticulomyxa filosa]
MFCIIISKKKTSCFHFWTWFICCNRWQKVEQKFRLFFPYEYFFFENYKKMINKYCTQRGVARNVKNNKGTTDRTAKDSTIVVTQEVEIRKLDDFFSKYLIGISNSTVSHKSSSRFGCVPWNCSVQYDINNKNWKTPRIELSPTTWKNWYNRHEAQTKELEIDPKSIETICSINIFIGDSITRAWQGDAVKSLFETYFSAANAKQKGFVYALDGDRIQEVGWRLFQQNAFQKMIDILLANQLNIFLLIGTNDFGSGEPLNVVLKEIHLLLIQFYTQFTNVSMTYSYPGDIIFHFIAILPRGEYWQRQDGNGRFITWNQKENRYFEMIQTFNQFANDTVAIMNDLHSHFHNNTKLQFRFIDCNPNLLSQHSLLF